jgi:hypothetical protein
MNADKTESVKLDCKVVKKVRDSKDKTGVTIRSFIERAITNELRAVKLTQKILNQQ